MEKSVEKSEWRGPGAATRGLPRCGGRLLHSVRHGRGAVDGVVAREAGHRRGTEVFTARRWELLFEQENEALEVLVKSSFLAEVQRWVLRAEASLREKEEENDILRQRVQQYEDLL
ncbi:myosin-related family protein [Striga asiatica]|uniref:Myosin-related family protein n=1 Tax=Striga asiatica TaxID=4170 RepID=A0A5A7R296_STRAF|nr:myosin-related family protein [Striga asiatica]